MTILAIMFPLVVTSEFILSEKSSQLTPYHFLTLPLYGEGTGIQGKSKPVLLVDPTDNVSRRNRCPEKTSRQAVIAIALYRDVGSHTIYLLSKYMSVYFVPGNFRSWVHSAEAHRCLPSPHRASSLAGKTELLRETHY